LGVFAEIGDGVSSEGDTALGVEAGAVVEHDGEASHSEYGIIDFDLSDYLLSVEFSEGYQFFIESRILSLRTGIISFSRMYRRLWVLTFPKKFLATNCINNNF
jgi:hypothetical protein